MFKVFRGTIDSIIFKSVLMKSTFGMLIFNVGHTYSNLLYYLGQMWIGEQPFWSYSLACLVWLNAKTVSLLCHKLDKDNYACKDTSV